MPKILIQYQSVFNTLRPIPAENPKTWGGLQNLDVPVKATLFAAALAFGAFVPRPAVAAAAAPTTWGAQSPELVRESIVFDDGSTCPQPPAAAAPREWSAQWPEIAYDTLQVEEFIGFPNKPTVALATGWWGASPEQFTAPKLPQRWPDFASRGTIVSTTPQGWWGQSPDQFARPLAPAQQQFSGTAPQAFAVTITFGFSQSPEQFTKPAVAREFLSFISPPAAALPTGWMGRLSNVTTRITVVETGGIAALLPNILCGWQAEFNYHIIPPLAVTQQHWSAYAPRVITPPSIRTWGGASPELVTDRALLVDFDIFPAPLTAAAIRITWSAQWPELAYDTALVEDWGEAPRTPSVAAVTPLTGWMGRSPEFTTRTLVYETSGRAVLLPIILCGWQSEFSYHIISPLAAAQQHWSSFAPRGAIFSITPQGWQFQQPDQFAAPFPVIQQQFTGFERIPPAVTITISFSQSPDLFAKPFPAPLQRWPDFAPRGAIVAVTPQGWNASWPPQLKAPMAEKLQQFSGFAVRGQIISITPMGWWGQSPEQFNYPVNAAKQQFGSLFLKITVVVSHKTYSYISSSYIQ